MRSNPHPGARAAPASHARGARAPERGSPPRILRPGVRLLLGCVLLVLPVAASGQTPGSGDAAPPDGAGSGTGWFPDSTAFRPVLAAPREVDLRGSLIVAEREAPAGADFQGSNLEAEVVLGHRLGIVRFQRESPDSPEVVLGFEVGVFNRFALETPEKALISAGYRVGFPVSVRKGPWSGRLTLLHFSSHVGDDFLARFGDRHPQRQMTRDGVELTLARRLLPGLRAYAGGDLNFHVNPGVPRSAGRGGLEWDPAPERRGGDAAGGTATWPFAAVDVETTSAADGLAATGAAGLALRVRGMTLRLEARAHTGPTPMRQLGGRDEDFLGIGLRVDPL